MAHKFVIHEGIEADSRGPLIPTPSKTATTTPDSPIRRVKLDPPTLRTPPPSRSSARKTPTTAVVGTPPVRAPPIPMDDQTASRLYEMSMRGKGPYDVISVNSEENNDVFDDGASREAEDDSFPDVHAPPPSFEPSSSFGRVAMSYASSDYSSTVIASNTTAARSPAGAAVGVPPDNNNMMEVPFQRERTYTDESESAASTGSVSKKTLVRLMREQVDLVRRLTNAQLSQKQELERVKEEKRALEERQREQEQQARQVQQRQQQEGGVGSYTMGLPQHSAPPRPPARSRVDTGDSGSVGQSTVSSFFKRTHTTHPRRHRHPDAKYFRNNNHDENTTAYYGNPSVASTIMPSSITVGMIDKRNEKAGDGGGGSAFNNPAYTGPGAINGYSRDRIEITHIPERNVVREEEGGGCITTMWRAFARICTLLLPDFCLFWIGSGVRITKGMSREAREEATNLKKEARQAWREKVAIFVIMMFFCAAFIGISGVIPMFLCRETTHFTLVSPEYAIFFFAGSRIGDEMLYSLSSSLKLRPK